MRGHMKNIGNYIKRFSIAFLLSVKGGYLIVAHQNTKRVGKYGVVRYRISESNHVVLFKNDLKWLARVDQELLFANDTSPECIERGFAYICVTYKR